MNELESAYLQTKSEIIDAYTFLRKYNFTIPSDTLEFMKDAAIEKLDKSLEDEKEHKHNKEIIEPNE